jgi:hypothetical protein
MNKYKEFEKTVRYEFDRFFYTKPLVVRWIYYIFKPLMRRDLEISLELVELYDTSTIKDFKKWNY